jgi:hypothetical protein
MTNRNLTNVPSMEVSKQQLEKKAQICASEWPKHLGPGMV